ncbi:MAG: succinyl-CoA synthetase subunit alpha [Candidatus Marinimicrobia bacterium]|nr:succinyl-CoA synthetase subunit alpha [Candidatus Neomarinimicrobiota bacterium]
MNKKILIEMPELSKDVQKKYAGKCIAIVNGEVIASGSNSLVVFKEARRKYPDKPTNEIILDYIPKEDFLIL